MADIFQAYDRDDDESWVYCEVMEKRGPFWYYCSSFDTEEAAREHANHLFTEAAECEGVIVDRVFREPLLRRIR